MHNENRTAKYWNGNSWIDIEPIDIKKGMTIYMVEPNGNVFWCNRFKTMRLKVTKDAHYIERHGKQVVELEYEKGEIDLND